MAPRWLLGPCTTTLALSFLLPSCEPTSETKTPEPSSEAETAEPPLEPAKPFIVHDPLPTQAEIDELLAQPAPAPTPVQYIPSPVGAWTMVGPTATTLESKPYSGDYMPGRVLAEVLEEHGVGAKSSAGLQCLAQQLGEFALEHGTRPANDIENFMAGRCGVVLARYGTALRIDAPNELPADVRNERSFRAALQRDIDKLAQDGVMGMWFGRNKQRSVQVRLQGKPQFVLEKPIALSTGGGTSIDIRGRSTWPQNTAHGCATRGKLGTIRCYPIPGEIVEPPQVALRCPIDTDQPFTAITISAGTEDWTARSMLEIVASHGALPQSYEAPRLNLPNGADIADRTALLEGLNALRGKLNRGPLTSAKAQTKTVERLMPWMFHGSDSDPQLQLARRASNAGHDIDADIRHGSSTHLRYSTTDTVERLLGMMLFGPDFRFAMLDGQTSQIAVASEVASDQPVRQTAMVVFSTFEPQDYSAERNALFDTIDRQRVARGLEPIARVDGDKDQTYLDATMDLARRGEQHPEQALQQMLRHFSTQTGRSFYGVVLAPGDLRDWAPQLTGDLVTATNVAAAATISYAVPEGSSRGHQLVAIIYTVL